MRYFFLIFLGVLAFAAPSAQAATPVCNPATTTCVTQPCDPNSLGTSTMDHDKQNIIACLCVDTACTIKKWKTMSVANLVCPSGQYLHAILQGKKQCLPKPTSFACSHGYAMTGIKDGVAECVPLCLGGAIYTLRCGVDPNTCDPVTFTCNAPAGPHQEGEVVYWTNFCRGGHMSNGSCEMYGGVGSILQMDNGYTVTTATCKNGSWVIVVGGSYNPACTNSYCPPYAPSNAGSCQ